MPQILLAAFVLTAGLYPSSVGVTKADYEPAPAPTSTVSNIAETRTVRITAYSSTPEETDDTPFVTASGQHVRDGIVATNLYPFGTKLRMPELFGDKVFEVQDRMHPRMKNYVDIWMDAKAKAKHFGVHETDIVVLK